MDYFVRILFKEIIALTRSMVTIIRGFNQIDYSSHIEYRYHSYTNRIIVFVNNHLFYNQPPFKIKRNIIPCQSIDSLTMIPIQKHV